MEALLTQSYQSQKSGPKRRGGLRFSLAPFALTASIEGRRAATRSKEPPPRLAATPRPEVMKAIGVSREARDLCRGRVPHPRHFAALAALSGVAIPAGDLR